MKYVCPVCGYVYDEEKEGTPFADLPESWVCPLCRAPKSSFRPEKGAEPPAGAPAADFAMGEAEKLSWGQMAALCTDLGRACEKQGKTEQAAKLSMLAERFTALVPPEPGASPERLEALLGEEIAAYPAVRGAVDARGDRGAARALVWGEKADRMLAILLERYRDQGESMLEGTGVWLCTACGFVYVGDAPPEQCPVCRVPAWKFEKVEG